MTNRTPSSYLTAYTLMRIRESLPVNGDIKQLIDNGQIDLSDMLMAYLNDEIAVTHVMSVFKAYAIAKNWEWKL